jgi:hypothetical protein
MTIKDLHKPLSEAIQRMIERPKGLHPFVVVNVSGTEQFVQFCGSMEEPLRFECPALDLYAQFSRGIAYIDEVSAAFAIQFMVANLGLPQGTEVEIDENPPLNMAS